MSALLPIAKAFEALADAMWEDGESLAALDPVGGQFLMYMAGSHRKAAEILRGIARDEASGPETCAGCGAAAPPPGKRCARCDRLKT